jgi:hypothetical protein
VLITTDISVVFLVQIPFCCRVALVQCSTSLVGAFALDLIIGGTSGSFRKFFEKSLKPCVDTLAEALKIYLCGRLERSEFFLKIGCFLSKSRRSIERKCLPRRSQDAKEFLMKSREGRPRLAATTS